MTAPEPRVPVIDMWAPFVPSAEVIDDLREGFPVELLSYFEVFTKTTISAEQFGAYAESLRRTDDQILDSLDDAGITRSLITGFDERSTCGVTFVHNASVAPSRPAIQIGSYPSPVPTSWPATRQSTSSSAGWSSTVSAG